MTNLHSLTEKDRQIISLERLFRGQKSALVIFGPKEVLRKFAEQLNLLELEDYSGVDPSKISVWEIGKNKDAKLLEIEYLFINMPNLLENEQFWWQVTLYAKKNESVWGRLFSLPKFPLGSKSEDERPKRFNTQIRAVVFSESDKRRNDLAATLQKIGQDQLIKIPRPYSNEQLYKNFVSRSMIPFSEHNLLLRAEEIFRLIGRS